MTIITVQVEREWRVEWRSDSCAIAPKSGLSWIYTHEDHLPDPGPTFPRPVWEAARREILTNRPLADDGSEHRFVGAGNPVVAQFRVANGAFERRYRKVYCDEIWRNSPPDSVPFWDRKAAQSFWNRNRPLEPHETRWPGSDEIKTMRVEGDLLIVAGQRFTRDFLVDRVQKGVPEAQRRLDFFDKHHTPPLAPNQWTHPDTGVVHTFELDESGDELRVRDIVNPTSSLEPGVRGPWLRASRLDQLADNDWTSAIAQAALDYLNRNKWTVEWGDGLVRLRSPDRSWSLFFGGEWLKNWPDVPPYARKQAEKLWTERREPKPAPIGYRSLV